MTDWHPIRVVAKRTGLSPHVIRAWEKRYEAVRPTRTPTGRRVYSNEDLERLMLLRQATLLGRSIGQIAKVPTEELRAIVEEDEAAVAEENDASPPVRQTVLSIENFPRVVDQVVIYGADDALVIPTS